jgi:hypothetical protein
VAKPVVVFVVTTLVVAPPANVPLAVVVGAVNVTLTAVFTRFPPWSSTFATSAGVNGWLICTLAGNVLTWIWVAGPTTLVSVKVAAAGTFVGVVFAVTLNAPMLLLAVSALEVASPLALVVAVFTPPANDALAPVVLLGTMVNVTFWLFTGFPAVSVTKATRGVNADPSATDWGEVPALTAIDAAGPEVFISCVKVAGVDIPAAVAVTLYAGPAFVFTVAVTVAVPMVPVEAEVTVAAGLKLAMPGPEAGPAKVTGTPGTPLPPESTTVATSGCAKAAPVGNPAGAVWLLPLVMLIATAWP